MSDDPIFLAEESGLWAHEKASEMPTAFEYVGSVPEESIPSEMPRIYLDRAVAQTLQSEGQRSIEIDREVAGILLGTRTEDNQSIRVSHIAIARDEDSSPVHFKFTYSVWDDLIDQMESLSREAGRELLLVAWYHTHPNMSVFLSRYDLRTHRDFHRPYQFALVLAPQRGTEQTSVGFFCNRGEGTPLLPGLRLYGDSEGPAPPWHYESEPNEDFEEGEGLNGQDDNVVEELRQFGEVGTENPNWLTLGSDPVEGPVLPILEGMASSVVGGSDDRIAVLLGTKTPREHITITRVRFMGRTSQDLVMERGELLGALRFMAETFPAGGDPKILGIVRIVSPRRFKSGDVFDPDKHNLRIAQLLSEVDYDLDAVPFQVGLVLYPGVYEDKVLFQAFAQRRDTHPVYLNSFRAVDVAPPGAEARYGPVGDSVLRYTEDPCLRLPESLTSAPLGGAENLADTLREAVPGFTPAPEAETDRLMAPSPILARALEGEEVTESEGSVDGIDWHQMARDEAPVRWGRDSLMLLVAFAIGLLGVGMLIVQFATDGPDEGSDLASAAGREEAADSPPSVDPLAMDAPAVASGSEAYVVELLGCEGERCAPFAAGARAARSADLVRLERRPAYLESTLKPIELWVVRHPGTRNAIRLQRRNAGQDVWIFAVSKQGRDWTAFWGDGRPFDARLIVVPQGVPLAGDHALASLRVERKVRLTGPPVEVPETTEDEAVQEEPPSEVDRGPESWVWRSGETSHSVGYDAGKRAFDGRLLLSGPDDGSGRWTLSYQAKRGAASLAESSVVDPPSTRGGVDLTRSVTQLMRNAAVLADLRGREGGAGEAFVTLGPPGTSSSLLLRLRLSGKAADQAVSHKVCVMMAGPGGQGIPGRARVGPAALMRPTFDPTKGGQGECADGGATGRWAEARFGPGRTVLQFFHEGTAEGLAPARGVVQRYRLPERWSTMDDKCLAITIHVDDGGWRTRAPSVIAQYDLEGGSCR
ncbi:MAG: Mov34/MPN/PAD-1 family protein [Myxococcota bacterium]|nr:Mov34/MPN/PAD-1 family protein [Myxococcota bacterium]